MHVKVGDQVTTGQPLCTVHADSPVNWLMRWTMRRQTARSLRSASHDRASLFAMPGNEVMTRSLAGRLGAELGDVELRAFPDGETYLRFVSDIAGRSIAIICTLDRPNDKILP